VNDEAPDPLLRALTAPGTPEELAGEQAAVALFHAARRSPARPARRMIPSFGIAAAAAGLAAAALAGGAYSAVLPGPLQHMAHKVLAPIGVPDTGKPHTATPATAGSATPEPVASAAPRPRSTLAPVQPALAVAHSQILAGSTDRLTLRVPAGPGVRVELLVRAAGTDRWHQVATAVTGRGGETTFVTRRLTRNTVFRVAVPGQPASVPVAVTVLPRLTFTVTGGSAPGTATVTVSSHYADPGDLVMLQILVRGGWKTVAEQQLSLDRKAAFVIAAGGHGPYRIDLPATATHGQSTTVVRGSTR
jgi:hypothetical protein